MYFVYILQSEKDGSYYTGQTQNVADRLVRHNAGAVPSTRRKMPYRIVYQEEFATRAEAIRRESEIKSYKGGNAFKKLLNEL
jgi:putative endonuclease